MSILSVVLLGLGGTSLIGGHGYEWFIFMCLIIFTLLTELKSHSAQLIPSGLEAGLYLMFLLLTGVVNRFLFDCQSDDTTGTFLVETIL